MDFRSPIRRALTTLIASAALLIFTTPASMQGQRAPARAFLNGREVIDGEVLVKFKDMSVSAQGRRAFVEAQVDADDTTAVGSRGLRRMHSRGLKTAEMLAFLRTHPDVEYVEPNYVVYASDFV